MAIAEARFGHVNLVAHDWQALAAFYQDTFGCSPVPPERDYRGRDLDAGTGLRNAHLRGAHLRLPGHGQDGPTLEIYSYDVLETRPKPTPNRVGWGHIAFGIADVAAARVAVLDAGGNSIGDVVTLAIADGRQVTWCYVTDPEGNIVELQSWSS
jgi:catechol 2,3-dioxygenase-like lactoylglutathione lyase family enzyme